MKRLTVMTVLAAVMGGCAMNDGAQKAEAYQRWYQARAHVLYGVAAGQFKVGDLEKAQAYAGQALALEKDYVPARVLLAKVCLERGQYSEAAEELRRAETLASGNPEIPYLLGVALEKREEYAEALKCYQKARALDPNNDACVTASAEVLVKLDRPRLALQLLETRLERNNGSPEALALAGEVALLAGEPDKAVGFYQRCLDIQPDSLKMRENIAKALFFAKRYDEALQALGKLADTPQYCDNAGWVYLMSGHAYLAMKRPREAQGAYETASRIDPADPLVWVSLAKAAMPVRDYPRAILASRQALALAGDCVEAVLLLGYASLREGRSAEAIDLLKAAAQKHPQDRTLWCMLGRCYAAGGQNDRAVSCYLEALKSDPEDRLARGLLNAAGTGPPPR
jgi:tetratricopeptide (TPR) repeat protein